MSLKLEGHIRWRFFKILLQAARIYNDVGDAPKGFHKAVSDIQDSPPSPVCVGTKPAGWGAILACVRLNFCFAALTSVFLKGGFLVGVKKDKKNKKRKSNASAASSNKSAKRDHPTPEASLEEALYFLRLLRRRRTYFNFIPFAVCWLGMCWDMLGPWINSLVL